MLRTVVDELLELRLDYDKVRGVLGFVVDDALFAVVHCDHEC